MPQSGDLFHWGVKMGYPYKNLWRKPPIERLLQNFRNMRFILQMKRRRKFGMLKMGVPHEVGL